MLENCKHLPLHLATVHSRSPAVVAREWWAETVYGHTPLDRAERNTGPGAEEIKSLLRAAMR
jgi:hypothetical protein